MASIDTHKTALIKRILEVNNQKILTSIDLFLNNNSSNEIITASVEQKKSILQGIKDIENGNFYSQEEIDKKDLQWLNEK